MGVDNVSEIGKYNYRQFVTFIISSEVFVKGLRSGIESVFIGEKVGCGDRQVVTFSSNGIDW